MGIRTKIYCVAVSACALLAGCNLFNPSGTGSNGNDAQSNLAQGEALYQQGDFTGSMDAFQRAILEDSNSSLAYYGYAKANVRFYDITVNSILADIDSTQNQSKSKTGSGNIAFLNHDTLTLTRRLEAAIKVNFVLSILDNRDSLTRFFNFLKDTTSKSQVAIDSSNDTYDSASHRTLYKRHIAFMEAYLAKSDADSAGYYQRSQFPLTDFAMPMSNILADFAVYKLLFGITQTYDLNHDGIIEGSELAFMKQIKISSSGDSGGGIGNLVAVKGTLATTSTDSATRVSDSVTRVGLNASIQNLSSNLGSASSLIAAFLPQGNSSKSDSDSSSSSSSLSSNTSNNVDSVISSLGGAITFYQFGDHLDNDGDGCIDEEILDGVDNDADGFVDEDARVAVSADTVNYPDLIDNDHNGKVDLADGSNETKGSNHLLGFVNTFLNKPGYTDSTFIHIKSGASNMNLRIQIQNDSLSLPKNASKLSTTLKAELDSAKSLIGGCWRNYP